MKQLAVIILNWNGLQLLKQFIPTAAKYTIDHQTDLIVADNGSSDGSTEWISQHHPEVKIIKFNKNHGFAGGYNRAIQQTNYPYTILLNSDVEVSPNWASTLLRHMLTHPDTGACQPKILSWHEKQKFEYAGAAGGYIDRNGYPYCRGRLFSSIETDNGQYDTPTQIAWASGAALMVNTKIYLDAGGLDQNFFAHMEEIDLCCRIFSLGYKIMCIPQAKVWHVGGASLNQGNPKKTYLNFRNNLLLLHKNLPTKTAKNTLLRRRLLDTLAWAMYIAKLDFKNANAIIKAHRDFRRMKKTYTTQPSQNYMAQMPGAKRNILIDYYLKHQRK